jgi:hypothetical protein
MNAKQIYNRNYYKLQLLKRGIMPKMDNLAIRLQNATNALISTKSMLGSGVSAFSDRDLEKMSDDDLEMSDEEEIPDEDAVDITEENYNYRLYRDSNYSDYLKLSTEKLTGMERRIDKLLESPAGEIALEVIEILQDQLENENPSFYDVKPARRRVIIGIMNDMSDLALFHPSQVRKIDGYIEEIFA